MNMATKRRTVLATLLLAACGTATVLATHPIPVVPVTAYASRHKLTLRADVFVEDLKLFHRLEANELDFVPPDQVKKGVELHKQFLLDKIQVRDADGVLIKGQITEVVMFDMDERGISIDLLMEQFVSYQMEFTIDSPEFLTFTQKIGADRLLPSEVTLNIKQEGSDASYRKVLRPSKPYTYRFDWSAPPLSKDASEAELKKWHEQRRQDTLGIDQYGSVYSFIYITPREVRHEVLIPLGTLESDFKIDREDPAFLAVAEQEAGTKQVIEAFDQLNPVKIDGVVVTPIVDRVDFYGLKLKDFAVRAKKRPVSTASCRVGIILRYPTKSAPQNMEVLWDKFDRNILRVDAVVFTRNKPSRHTFTKTNPKFTWTADGALPPPAIDSVTYSQPNVMVPLLSLVCLTAFPALLGLTPSLRSTPVAAMAIAALLCLLAWFVWPYGNVTTPFVSKSAPNLNEKQADEIFATLHRNTYRAFDYDDESDIYDALDKSVDGELLNSLFLQIRSRQAMQEQGGALAHVESVEIVEGKKQSSSDDGGFQYLCRWTVSGTVEHWGHVHNRVNEYDAKFTVQPRNDAWKITGLEITGERRLKFNTSLRDF